MNKKVISIFLMIAIGVMSVGCGVSELTNVEQVVSEVNLTTEAASESLVEEASTSQNATTDSSQSVIDVAEMFSSRDLEQAPDLTDATVISLASNEDVLINTAGVYVFSGSVTDSSIIVDADDEAKVQLVLDGVTIVNENKPAITVLSGDKVYVTTTDSDNYLQVTDFFVPENDINLDAVIYSKSDLVLNGLGNLEVVSEKGNGITSKDDLKVTGGTYVITSSEDALEANDSIRIYDGDITIDTGKDGLHSENDEDLTLGYIYIQGGSMAITAADDAIRANSIVQIDGGMINIITCTEGIEGTNLQINGGTIDIYSTDDGINAAKKSDYEVLIEVNDGTINIVMSSGDTDGLDSNGNIIINGGTISIEGNSTFDADGSTTFNGGTVIINGEEVTDPSVLSSMQGGKRGRK